MDQCAATWQRNCGELWRGTLSKNFMINRQFATVLKCSVVGVPMAKEQSGSVSLGARLCCLANLLLVYCVTARKPQTRARSLEGRSHHPFGGPSHSFGGPRRSSVRRMTSSATTQRADTSGPPADIAITHWMTPPAVAVRGKHPPFYALERAMTYMPRSECQPVAREVKCAWPPLAHSSFYQNFIYRKSVFAASPSSHLRPSSAGLANRPLPLQPH
jgi:hypothetical protein